MKNHSMYWNWIYWLCDCDSTELAIQVMKIMNAKGERRRRLERLMCEKGR